MTVSNQSYRQGSRIAHLVVALTLLAAGTVHGCTSDFSGPGDPRCGDGTCAESEDPATCPIDCPAQCGDGACTHSEDPADCPEDCSANCGDGVCILPEDPADCPEDCPAVCGDGYVTHAEECDDGNLQSGDGCGTDCQWEGVEIQCDNAIDDDGDGFVDCEDNDCSTSPACDFGATCDEIWTCVQGCGIGPACISSCENTGCESAVEVFGTLENCLNAQCLGECISDLGSAACQGCLNTNCGAMLADCAANTCP